MAYLFQNEEDQEQQEGQTVAAPQGGSVVGAPQEQQQTQSTPPAQPTGQSAQVGGQTAGSQTSGSAAPRQQAQRPKGSGFMNVQRFLDQNRQGAGQLGQQVAGQVTAKAQDARQNIQGLQGQFQQQVNQGVTNFDQGLVDQVKTNAQGVAQDENQAQAFRNMLNAQYQGPDSLDETDSFFEAQEKIRQARDKANLVQSDEGREQILKGIQQSRNQGVTNLNNFLLQQTPEAQQAIQGAAGSANDLDSLIQDAVAQSKTMADQARAQTDEARNRTREESFGVLDSIKGDVLSRQQQAVEQAANFGNLKNQLIGSVQQGNPPLTPEQLQQLNISEEDYSNLLNSLGIYDQAYADFMNFGNQVRKTNDKFANVQGSGSYERMQNRINSAIRAAGPKQDFRDLSGLIDSSFDVSQFEDPNAVATPEQIAQYQALSDLMGEENNFLNNASAAGSANSFVNFDIEELLNNITGGINNLAQSKQNLAKLNWK